MGNPPDHAFLNDGARLSDVCRHLQKMREKTQRCSQDQLTMLQAVTKMANATSQQQNMVTSVAEGVVLAGIEATTCGTETFVTIVDILDIGHVTAHIL